MYSTSILTVMMISIMNLISTTELAQDLSALGLKIQQDDNVVLITSSTQSITLAKEKFSIFFNLKKDDDVAEKFYAARLIADIDPDIFKQFEANKSFEEVPSLALGTSMAGPKDAPYNCIFFDDQAHHYIFYSNEEEKRAHLINKENEVLQLSFDIQHYCMQDLEVNISNSNFEQIFFVFFIDKNLNEVVDEGEFVKLEINFE